MFQKLIKLFLILLLLSSPLIIIHSLQNTEVVITVPSVFLDETVEDWQPFINLLNDNQHFNIRVQYYGEGGKVGQMLKVAIALVRAQARHKKVVFQVIEAAVSSHAYLLCFAKNVEVLPPRGSLYFHTEIDYNEKTKIVSFDLNEATSKQRDFLFSTCKARGFIDDNDIQLMRDKHKSISLVPLTFDYKNKQKFKHIIGNY